MGDLADYGSCYFCRVNIGAANPRITDGLLSLTEMGQVLASFKIAYSLGQLINGQLAERFGSRRILWIGLFGAAANLTFGFGVGFWSLLVAWALNGFFQAALWPSCVKIMANWFPPLQRGRAMGVIGTSYQLGSALALSVMGYVIVGFGNSWRAAFFLPAAVFLVVAIPAALSLRSTPRRLGTQNGSPANSRGDASSAQVSFAEILKLTLSNPRVWVLGVGLAGLNFARYGFLDWAPKYLNDVKGLEITKASLQTAVLPLGGVLGVLAAGWISDRLFQTRRAPVISVMLVCLAVLTVAFEWTVEHRGWLETVICLSAIGFFIYGPQVMLVGTAPADLARRDLAAAAVGLVDALAYVGAAASGFTGWLVERYDWQVTIYAWAGVALAAAALTATLWNARSQSAS